MRPKTHAHIGRIAGKEITLFFASPIAYLFLATFAAISLFVFFWGEAFFARNIADVRPLFEWMPVLLIFLASALTMRLWSEERRTGTLEHVLTQPVPLWQFVIGKFVGCLFLLGVALVITLPLPITVDILGDLDWGPVAAGYLATFLLGAAYLSIGLFVSARSDNQIVSLISATALCAVFYVIGTPMITDFFGHQLGEWLRQLSTGARFEAITRGVIDIRDLYYYLSIIAVFLTLNTYSLEKERWAATRRTPNHAAWRTVTALLLINALGANLWLNQLHGLRIDATAGNQYSISDATHSYLNQLQEPLLLRGYFSSKTHPLLSPLVPQIRDLMEEYEIAGRGKVRVEFIDPATAPELEEEANQKFGIQPVPFQVADRYQASIVSSYFNVLVQYGDEHQILGFRDLIEVKARSEADLDVQLRNPEHDLTRAIKKVLHSYQAGGNLFDTVQDTLTFTAYVSSETALPETLIDFKQSVRSVLDQLKAEAGDRLQVNFIDPAANGGQVGQQIAQDYGFQPMATNLLSDERFYFYMILAGADQAVQIPLGDLTAGNFERNVKAGIKRFANGFSKTVALFTPAAGGYSQYGSGGPQFTQLEGFLNTDMNVIRETLDDGRVTGEADILVVAAPKDLNQKQLFAIDQFLMQGGTVIMATSPFSADLTNRNLDLQRQDSGVDQWLAHHGLSIAPQLVLDPQSAALPIPVTRSVGGLQFQELRLLDYPYFVDVRGEGTNSDNPITGDLPQATLTWASPIKVAEDRAGERQITELLRSSEQSWLSDSTDVIPRMDQHGLSRFQPQGETGSQLLGVISSGRFDSYFAGKASPLLANDPASGDQEQTENADSADETTTVSSVIERSPESARIILFSSNDFLSDRILQLATSATRSQYLNTLQLLANSVDWSLEDAGLLSIRSRGHFNRTLPPMEHDAQLFWEYLNYALALVALAVVAVLQRTHKRARLRRFVTQLAG